MINGLPIDSEGYEKYDVLKDYYNLFETILSYNTDECDTKIERIDLEGQMVCIVAQGALYYDRINIDSLTRVCREWVVEQGYILVAQYEPDHCVVKLYQYGEEITFRGDEFESMAFFKVSKFVLASVLCKTKTIKP